MTYNRRREDKSVFCDGVAEVLMVVFINLLLVTLDKREKSYRKKKEVSFLEKLILILISSF
jgi:hypothetical protein